MAYSIVPTVTTGDLWTAANHNTYIRDNFAASVPDLFTAKGDLVVATGADAGSRLAVGTNGYELVADSAQATGLKWAMNEMKDALTAKGQIIVATAADAYTVLSVGSNSAQLVADSAQSSGMKWVNQISAQYCRISGGDQTITDGTLTKVSFDSVDHDPHSVLGSGRFTANVAGYYQIYATIMFRQSPNQYGMFCRTLTAIYHNGTIWASNQNIHYGTETGYPSVSCSCSVVKNMAVNDYIEVYGRGYNGYTGWAFLATNSPKVTYMDVTLTRPA